MNIKQKRVTCLPSRFFWKKHVLPASRAPVSKNHQNYLSSWGRLSYRRGQSRAASPPIAHSVCLVVTEGLDEISQKGVVLVIAVLPGLQLAQ